MAIPFTPNPPPPPLPRGSGSFMTIELSEASKRFNILHKRPENWQGPEWLDHESDQPHEVTAWFNIPATLGRKDGSRGWPGYGTKLVYARASNKMGPEGEIELKKTRDLLAYLEQNIPNVVRMRIQIVVIVQNPDNLVEELKTYWNDIERVAAVLWPLNWRCEFLVEPWRFEVNPKYDAMTMARRDLHDAAVDAEARFQKYLQRDWESAPGAAKVKVDEDGSRGWGKGVKYISWIHSPYLRFPTNDIR